MFYRKTQVKGQRSLCRRFIVSLTFLYQFYDVIFPGPVYKGTHRYPVDAGASGIMPLCVLMLFYFGKGGVFFFDMAVKGLGLDEII